MLTLFPPTGRDTFHHPYSISRNKALGEQGLAIRRFKLWYSPRTATATYKIILVRLMEVSSTIQEQLIILVVLVLSYELEL